MTDVMHTTFKEIGTLEELRMRKISPVTRIIALVALAVIAQGRSPDEWKSRVIYQVKL